MTYRANDESKLKLRFDNATVMRPLTDKCLNQCKQPDCSYGSFDVANIINDAGNGTLSLEIASIDHRTEVIALISKKTLVFWSVVYFHLFFGFNVYEQLFKNLCLRNYFSNLKRKKKRKKQSCKLALFSFITLIVGLIFGTLNEWQLFNFGKEDKRVVIKRESTYEINVSTSICFNFSAILKDQNSSFNEEDLSKMNFKELNELTWSVKDFKKVSSMRNNINPIPIRHEGKKINVFYRNFKKCFLIYYETKQLFPHIYLQRKSHIFFNVTGTKFNHFYVEKDEKYPQLNSPEILKSTLFTLRENALKSKNCKIYSLANDGCLCKDDCIQDCALKAYLEKSSLPAFINLKEINFNDTGHLKFNNDFEEFERTLEKCKLKFPILECNSVNITLRPKFIVKDQNDISINLTPNNIVYKEVEDEDKLVVFNRILGLLLILTGFSVREFFDELISIYLSLLPTAAIINFRLTKRLVNLIVFLLFSTHFIFLFHHIVYSDLLQISYKNSLDKIVLPKIRICYEIDINLDFNNFTKEDLDKGTLSFEEFFIGLNYLDSDFNHEFSFVNGSDTEIFSTQTFYLDNLKCFSIAPKYIIDVSNVNILMIDQLITIFINLKNKKMKNKRYLVYLNVENTIDLEWSTFLFNATYYNLYFSTKQFYYEDSYFFLKNLKNLFRTLLNLSFNPNTQKEYFYYLRKSYNDEQFVTTTAIPLEEHSNLPIKNSQFNSFIHFRSIDGNKNKWNFIRNSKLFRYSYDLHKEQPEKRNEDITHKSIIALRPNLSCLKNKFKNKYHVIEFFLHLLILISFWLKLDLIRLPDSLKDAYPVIKFFINLFLYIVVCFLIFIFDAFFKFFSFFK